MNMNFKAFTKYALFICLALLLSNSQIYCETKSDESIDLDSAIKHNYKVYSERKDNNYYALLDQMQTWTFSGTIKSVTDGNHISVKTKDREVSVRFLQNNALYFKTGDYVSITSLPYRENANKVISAVGMSIEKTNTEVNVVSNAKASQSLGPIANGNNNTFTFGKPNQTPIVMNRNCYFSGKVTKIINKNSIIVQYGSKDIMLTLRNREGAILKVGDKVTVSCVPYKEERNGMVLARAIYIKK